MIGRRKSRLRVSRTDGDFAHAGRGDATLSCCTTTTCLVFVGALGGGLIGLVGGIIAGVKAANVAQTGWFVATIQVVGTAFLWTVVLGFIGGAIGLGLDRLGLF